MTVGDLDHGESRRVANENLVAAFDLVREHLGRPAWAHGVFGSVHAIASAHELAFYNPILALEPATTHADVRAAVAWMDGQSIPPSVHLADAAGPDVAAVTSDLLTDGFTPDEEREPVMILTPIPAAPAPPAGVAIRIGGAELAESFYAVYSAGERFRRTFGPGLLGDPRFRIAALELEGEPVAVAAAARSGATLGVYAVATVEHARRRGFGRAVTWAVIEAAARDWASTAAILQSSAMGRPMYESMGFVAVDTITIFKRPAAA